MADIYRVARNCNEYSLVRIVQKFIRFCVNVESMDFSGEHSLNYVKMRLRQI